jgi:hypothetical protein
VVKNTYSENALGTNHLDELVGGRTDSVALGISLEVAQVTNVAFFVGGSTVGLAVRVDWVVVSFCLKYMISFL